MKKPKIDVEYCECGCHCVEIKSGNARVSFYDDLKGTIYLNKNGCGMGGTLFTFKYDSPDGKLNKSHKDAQKKALEKGKRIVVDRLKSSTGNTNG